MEEIWKDISEFEKFYQVSNLGKVRSKRKNCRSGTPIMRMFKNNGYMYVLLYDGKGGQKHMAVHRLVAKEFIPNPQNFPQVNHKDENKENNCADNLEWCTGKYNVSYGTRRDRMAKSKLKPVFQYSVDGNLINRFDSALQAAKQFGFDRGSIADCCRGKRKTYRKYIWKYE